MEESIDHATDDFIFADQMTLTDDFVNVDGTHTVC